MPVEHNLTSFFDKLSWERFLARFGHVRYLYLPYQYRY